AGTGSEFGFGWSGNFQRKVTVVDSSTADLTTGAGRVYRFTNKDLFSGLYTPPSGAFSALAQDLFTSGWTETLPNGTVMTYDSSGVLQTLRNMVAATWTLNRDGGGRVTSAVSPSGSRTSFVYDTGGNIRRVQDSGGR